MFNVDAASVFRAILQIICEVDISAYGGADQRGSQIYLGCTLFPGLL